MHKALPETINAFPFGNLKTAKHRQSLCFAQVEGMIPDCLSQETALRQYGQKMWAEGFKEGKLEVLLSLLKQGIITEEVAAREIGMTVKAFRKAAAELANASDG